MLVLDTGSFCTIGEHVWNASPARPFLASSNGRYMGTSIPTAIGAAVADRNTPVICVVGDGGMRMYPSELKLAVKEGLPLCVILMSDGLYGSIACVPQAGGVSRRAMEIDHPSWVDSVAGMGCHAVLADDETRFQEAMQSWDHRRPLFIEVPFDAGRYAAMTRDLR
jgi:acetolactate synthase-1/2/3 large subunit